MSPGLALIRSRITSEIARLCRLSSHTWWQGCETILLRIGHARRHAKEQTRNVVVSFWPSNASNRAFEDMGSYATYKATEGDGKVLDEYVKRLRPARDSVRRNLILQHYGAPTPFVDVTHDIKIAEWFALNKIAINAGGLSTTGTVKAPFRGAAIFLFLIPCDLAALVDTAELVASTQSLCPHRQRCALLGGAGNLYRNAAS